MRGADGELENLRARAAGPAADDRLRMAAARALFEHADLRMREAVRHELEARPLATLEELLRIDDRLDASIRAEVSALCNEGLEFTQRVLEAEAEHPEARLYRALHTSLIAWSKTALAALAGGWGGRVTAAIDAAQAPDPTRDSAAPLRLKGRFLARAPWPYGDAREGLRLLEAAVAAAPVALNWLFLGDARFEAGDREGAAEAWRRVLQAPAGATLRAALASHRADALRRLDLL